MEKSRPVTGSIVAGFMMIPIEPAGNTHSLPPPHPAMLAGGLDAGLPCLREQAIKLRTDWMRAPYSA